MFKKLLSLLLMALMCASACFALVSCGGGNDENIIKSPLPLNANPTASSLDIPSDFKIGFIFLHDEASTYDKNFIDSAKRMIKALGLSESQYFFKTNIPEEGDDCYNAAKDLVNNKGCNIVFADSFNHEGGMLKAAKEHPNVQFCHATGTKALVAETPNLHNAFASIYEGRYLAGITAGLKLNEMIAEGKITAEQAVMGYVGAFPYAEVVSGYTSFYLGAKSVCPSVTMKVRYTLSWYDPAKEQEAANSLMNIDNCVLISQHADSLGAPSACEVKGVPNVSYNGSTIAAGPNTFIVSSAIDWTPYFIYIVQSYVNGTAIDANWTGTIQSGSVVLSDINGNVAAEGTLEALNTAIAALKAGTLHVFDTDTFTVNGEKLTSYLADVEDMGDWLGETEVIKTEGGKTFFAESFFRSAPYFAVRIDGITEINAGN